MHVASIPNEGWTVRYVKQEFLLCLNGDIRLGPEEQEVELRPGVAVCSAADPPHTYSSISGPKALLVMQYPPAQGIVP
jgi:hypothetical protein